MKVLIVRLLLEDVVVVVVVVVVVDDNDNGVDKNWRISFTRGRSLTLGQS
jgi:hypothetical protein